MTPRELASVVVHQTSLKLLPRWYYETVAPPFISDPSDEAEFPVKYGINWAMFTEGLLFRNGGYAPSFEVWYTKVVDSMIEAALPLVRWRNRSTARLSP